MMWPIGQREARIRFQLTSGAGADVQKRGGAELLELASQLAPLLAAPKIDDV